MTANPGTARRAVFPRGPVRLADWPEIYFVRHGQTDWNAEGRYQGTRDVPLNAVGRAQATANGEMLRGLFERDGRSAIDFAWFSSPLSRAIETAERLLAAFEPPYPEFATDPRLIEISFGVFEGHLVSELGDEPIRPPGLRGHAYWGFRPDNGENYDDLAARIAAFRERLAGPAVIVAHGGVLRVLRHVIAGTPRAEVVNWTTPQDAVYHFGDGRMTAYPATGAALD